MTRKRLADGSKRIQAPPLLYQEVSFYLIISTFIIFVCEKERK